MISGSFTTQTKVHSETTSGDTSASLITTGSVSLPLLPSNPNVPVSTSDSANSSTPPISSLPTRERRRSLSVDLVNQPSSMLLRDRNSAITVSL